MLGSSTSRLCLLTVLSAVLVAASIPAAASAATQRYARPTGSGTACSSVSPCAIKQAVEAASSGDEVTINFDVVTTTGDWNGGQALGTFAMTGALADAGTVRIAYRLAGQRINATTTLIGAKGIMTIGVRATYLAILGDRQSAVGRWRTCGGTGPYQRLRGQGSWAAVVDFVAARRPACHGP